MPWRFHLIWTITNWLGNFFLVYFVKFFRRVSIPLLITHIFCYIVIKCLLGILVGDVVWHVAGNLKSIVMYVIFVVLSVEYVQKCSIKKVEKRKSFPFLIFFTTSCIHLFVYSLCQTLIWRMKCCLLWLCLWPLQN